MFLGNYYTQQIPCLVAELADLTEEQMTTTTTNQFPTTTDSLETY